MIVFYNGSFCETADCRVPVNDRGLTLGDGVFDTMLAVDGKPVWAQEHEERLIRHAEVLKLRFDIDLSATISALLHKNNFTQGRYAIRTTLTRGTGQRGLAPPDNPQPTVIMTASPAPEPARTVRAVIAQTVRRNEHSPLSRIKSLNYGDNLLALMEAKDKGADDAIMLNTAGHVCCATTSNIFIREQGRYLTPPLADGVLDGITRARFIADNNAVEESFDVNRLRAAETIILTNSVAGMREAVLK